MHPGQPPRPARFGPPLGPPPGYSGQQAPYGPPPQFGPGGPQPRPFMPPPSVSGAAPAPAYGGKDGKDLAGDAGRYLDYLSQLTRDLGVPDPVERYFTPVVGQWSQLHEEAARWRAAAKSVEDVTTMIDNPLGSLDAAWHGESADSFVQYMGKVGLAGNDMFDAMNTMADVLDSLADGIRTIVTELTEVLTDTAEAASQAMAVPVSGEARARQYLDEIHRPTAELFESVKDVLTAFAQLCEGVQGEQPFGAVTMAHKMPDQNWALPAEFAPPPAKEEPAKDAATAPAGQPAAPAAPTGGGGGGSGGGSGGGGGGVPKGGAGHPGGGHPDAAPSGAGVSSGAADAAPPPSTGAAAAPAAAAASAGPAGPGGAPMGGGMMGGMGGAGGKGGGDTEHKSKVRVEGDPAEVFGKPGKTAPPVIGG